MSKILEVYHTLTMFMKQLMELIVVIMTEWNEFRALDLPRIKRIMNGSYILDTRNIISMSELSRLGFVYDNVGRIKI